MSSVHAVTEDIVFKARVASFYPLDYNEMCREFSEWLSNKQHDYHLIVYKVSVDCKGESNG